MSDEPNLTPDQSNIRWNLAALMLDVTFFALGIAFLDGSAVLPLLLSRLGASGLLIGGSAALRFFTFAAFQIFVAYGLHGKLKQKPWLSFVATITRLPLLSLPWFIWRATQSPMARLQALWVIILLLGFWGLGDGLGYVPWMEIVARAFTGKVRGRFFAVSQIVSGIGSIVIGIVIVRTVLNSPHISFPMNYAILAGAAAIMYQISLIGVLLIREPNREENGSECKSSRAYFVAKYPTLAAYLKSIPAILKGNPVFVRLATIQLLLGFGTAASNFYILYAQQKFHIRDEWGGIYQACQALGVILLMPVWTYLSEKRGPATSVRALGLSIVLTPLIALISGYFSPQFFALVFLLMGGGLGWGMWIVMNHYLLSHVEEHERPVFVALINLIFVPSAIYPVIGGLLVRGDQLITFNGIPILFVLTFCVVSVGFCLSLRLKHTDA